MAAVAALTAVALLLVAAVPAAAQDPAAPAEPVAVEPGAGAIPFAALGFGDRPVRGASAATDFFLPLAPGSTSTGGSVLTIDLAWSPLLLADRSSATIAVGGRPLQSLPLTPEGAPGTSVTVPVPPDVVGEDGLFVELRFQMRATLDDCEDPTNPSLWATVRSTSTVLLGTAVTERDLTDLPAVLSRPAPDGTPHRLAVPDAADPDLLAAAGAAAFQLGRWDAAVHRDAVLDLALGDEGATAAPGQPVLVVGSLDDVASLPFEAPAGADRVVGVAAQGEPVAVITGRTPAEVRRAATAVADPAVQASLGGPVAVLGEEPAAGRPRTADPWTDATASFAQLGIDRQEVRGPGRHVVELAIERPPGWRTDRTAVLELRLDVGGAVAEGSAVQVTAAGIDLGTRRLRAAEGTRRLRFEVPGDQLDAELDGGPQRALDLRLAFELLADRQRCAPLEVDAVRAAVLPDSSWWLPHSGADELDVGRFPHPLLAGSASSDRQTAAVVVPDEADDVTVAAALQLAAALGRWAEPGSPVPLVTRVSDLGARRSERNLVFLGDAAGELGVELDLRDVAASTPGQAAAVLGLGRSPFDADRHVLVVEGEPDGLLLAARALATRAAVTELQGRQVAITGQVPQVLVATRGAEPPAALAPLAPARTDRGRLLVGAVLLGSFLAVVLVVVWFRWLRPRRRA